MQTQHIGSSSLQSSRLVYGCMRICGDNSDEARAKGKTAIRAAVDAGYNHFDHADIYAGGKSEELFAEVLKEDAGLREKIIITSKCGIRGADGEATSLNDSDADKYFENTTDSDIFCYFAVGFRTIKREKIEINVA